MRYFHTCSCITESKIYVIPIGELEKKGKALRNKHEFSKYKLARSKGDLIIFVKMQIGCKFMAKGRFYFIFLVLSEER